MTRQRIPVAAAALLSLASPVWGASPPCSLLPSNERPTAIAALISGLREEDAGKIGGHLHPRIRRSLPALRAGLQRQAARLGTPWEPSLFRAWRLRPGQAGPRWIACAEGFLEAHSHYGYDEQILAWFQLAGRTELGRIAVTLVPKEGVWRIGSWHFHQWTVGGRDFRALVQRALEAKEPWARKVGLDIAMKLTAPQDYLRMRVHEEIRALRGSPLSAALFTSALKGVAKPTGARSLILPGGPGVALIVPHTAPPCPKIAAALGSAASFLAGVQCRYRDGSRPTGSHIVPIAKATL